MTRMMKAILLAVCLSLTACATTYGPHGLTGGYSDERIDFQTVRVNFSGNGHTSRDKVWYYWIYRCAEVTRESGFDYFLLLKTLPAAAANQKSSWFSDNEQGTLVNTRSSRGGGYTYVPVYTPGGTITTYRASAIVRMFREPISDPLLGTPPYVLNAKHILKTLKPYVESGGETTVVSPEQLLRDATVVPSQTL